MKATVDESAMPPRCCKGVIPDKFIVASLSTTDLTVYRQKHKEFTADYKVYCHNKTCSKFLDPTVDQTGDWVQCPECDCKTCIICKQEAHGSGSETCPEDLATLQTLEYAERENFRRCYQCAYMVERNGGCNHMTCRCGSSFCYICGLRWRTCQCR